MNGIFGSNWRRKNIKVQNLGDLNTYVSKIVTELASPKKNDNFTFKCAGKQRLLHNGKSIDYK